VQKQIRSVQRHAETDIEQPRRRHRDPRPEVSMVRMDVPDSPLAQLHRVAGPDTRVEQGLHTLPRPFASTEDNSGHEW